MKPAEHEKMQETKQAPCGCKVRFMDADWKTCDPEEAVHQSAHHDDDCKNKPKAVKKDGKEK